MYLKFSNTQTTVIERETSQGDIMYVKNIMLFYNLNASLFTFISSFLHFYL